MNSLTRIMSYDKTKNQENCDCVECTNVKVEKQIVEDSPLSDEEIEQIIKERYFDKDEKTKTFIRKALRKHGNRYDYSNVIYMNNHTRVIIVCNNHNEPYKFLQIPNNHLRGARCCICYGNKKSTTEEFIKKSNDIHGVGTYDYSKVEYVSNHKNVIIICPKHGEFKQTPNNHLRGHGCMTCSGKQVLTTKEFIKRAKEIHGNLYDYSKVEYKNGKTKVCIICKNHNKPYEFYQRLNEHIRQKQGCPLCSGNKKSTTEEFIEKSNKIHGVETYDYSKVDYINAFVKVVIICPKHGKFTQKPIHHLRGEGCPKCKSSKGEILVRNWLIKNKIEFDEQKRFDDCRNKNPLPFDFYTPKYNLCIEYDGEQHFIPFGFNSKMTDEEKLENLKRLQLHDEIKNKYCENNNIYLLRIRYDENIEEKLTEYFQTHGIIKEQTIFDLK